MKLTVLGTFISGAVSAGSNLGNSSQLVLMLDAITTGLAPHLYFWRWENGLVTVVRAVVVAAAVAVGLRASFRRLQSGDAAHRSIGIGMAYVVVLTTWYLTQSRTGYFYARYLTPAAIVGLPVAAVVCAAWRARHGSRLGARVLVSGATALALVAAWAGPLAVQSGAGSAMFRDQCVLVRAHVLDGDAVAALQSGTLGYFVDGVVNLDGRVNPHVGPGVDLFAYIDRLGVDWICDDQQFFEEGQRLGPLPAPWRLVDRSRRFEIWHRDR